VDATNGAKSGATLKAKSIERKAANMLAWV